jgi:hypothetical protein
MLCTFTTKDGALIVRSDDIRRIADHETHTLLAWIEGELICTARVLGTAIENRDRIQQEELDLIDRVNQHHLRAQMQSQIQAQMAQQPPKVARGRQGAK